MIFDLTKKSIISHKPHFFYKFSANIRGMAKRNFSKYDAFVFQNCRGIHTFLCKETMDVLFIDSENRVSKILKGFRPWTFKISPKNSMCLVCLPEGSVEKYNIEHGDLLDLNAEVTKSTEEQLNEVGSLIEPTPKTVFNKSSKA